VTFLQNHDQIANGAGGRGERLDQIAGPAAFRAITAYWLLAPGTPMLFQGQEFCASSPFLYFADHAGDLGAAVRKGRAEFMSQFRSLAILAIQDLEAFLPDPGSETTFRKCKLRADERQTHHAAIALHRDLLKLRRDDPVLRVPRSGSMDGAVLGPRTFVLRFFAADLHGQSTSDHGDRLLIVNLGPDLHFDPASEPLLAPPAGSRWAILWSSEDPAYGGTMTAPLDTDENWRFSGHATVVLAPSRDA
jgi:maltooligosyltrehalose trehalohydrolase